MRPAHNRAARGVAFTAAGVCTHHAPALHQHFYNGSINNHLSAMRLNHLLQRLSKHPGTTARALHAAHVIHRVPQRKRRRQQLGGRRAGLCRHPRNHRGHMRLRKRLPQQLPVTLHQLLQIFQTIGAEPLPENQIARQVERGWRI